MAVFCEIWKICRKVIPATLFGLSFCLAQFELPYGKTVKDSSIWKCCYSEEMVNLVLLDDDRWTYSDYTPSSWMCCFIDSGLRRFEMWQSLRKIEEKKAEDVWKKKMDAADEKIFKSFPMVGPIHQDSINKRKCKKTGDGYEICGHRL